MSYAKRPLPPDDPRHGTRSGYQYWRCKCDLCRADNAKHQREYMARAPLAKVARDARTARLRAQGRPARDPIQ